MRAVRRNHLIVVTLAVALAPYAVPPAQTPDAGGESATAKRSGLVERTGRRLAQLDVSVSGPDEQVANLEAEDFELVVGARRYDDLIVDRLCERAEGGAERTVEEVRSEGGTVESPGPAAGPHPTFLFYFDQIHLTQRGRNEALQTAQELVPELIRDGARGIVVSSADDVVTYADLTDDPEVILDALRELHGDRHWDPFAEDERLRVEEVVRAFRDGLQQGTAVARRHQMEERWRTGRALRRLALVLARLADLDPPKAVFYFADTMRSNPGQHYVDLLPSTPQFDQNVATMESDAFSARNAFDRVINEAASHGVRLYTVQAQGLVTLSNASFGSRNSQGLSSGRARNADAENSLRGLAAETGGAAFVGGYSTRQILRTVREDMSCLYLISFDPTGLPLDAPLDVTLKVKRPKVEARVRGRIVVQSDSARLASTLLAAFGAPSTIGDAGEIHGSVLPTGYRDGRFRALLQVSVPGVPVPGAVWDLGASVVARERVIEDLARRIEVDRAGVPVVLEAEASFRPGPYAMVSVAHESVTGQTVSREVRGTWPDPRERAAIVAALTIVQPSVAIFVRDGGVRREGALAIAPRDPVRTDRPTAFVGLICWNGSQRAVLTVERTLSGENSAEFPPMRIEPNEDRCAYFRDLVREGTMTPGDFEYNVRVLTDEGEIVSAQRRFSASVGGRAADSGDRDDHETRR